MQLPIPDHIDIYLLNREAEPSDRDAIQASDRDGLGCSLVCSPDWRCLIAPVRGLCVILSRPLCLMRCAALPTSSCRDWFYPGWLSGAQCLCCTRCAHICVAVQAVVDVVEQEMKRLEREAEKGPRLCLMLSCCAALLRAARFAVLPPLRSFALVSHALCQLSPLICPRALADPAGLLVVSSAAIQEDGDDSVIAQDIYARLEASPAISIPFVQWWSLLARCPLRS